MRNRHTGNYRWENVDVLPYKEEGTHFKSISRQILFDGNERLPCQVRYFEIAESGHSTLERHDHLHVVIIVRGHGDALIGDSIHSLSPLDVVQIPSLFWHQFRANKGEVLGFLCLVHTERDRPQRPEKKDIEFLTHIPEIAAFIKL